MEKFELRKNLEKKRAYMVCLIVLLGLITPTLYSIGIEYELPTSLQRLFILIVFVIMAYTYKKMRKVKAQINSLARSVEVN